MPPLRPRISQKVLNELILKVRQDDPPRDQTRAIRDLFETWAFMLIGGAWVVLICIVAPILIILLAFGQNYTIQGFIVGGWLLGISSLVASLYFIAGWIEQSLHHGQPKNSSLLLGIALLAGTICATFLIWQGTNNDLPPLATVGAMTLLGVILIGWGVYNLVTERQTKLIFRVLFLIGMLCWSISLVIGGLSLKYAALGIDPEINQTMRAINLLLSPIGSLAIVLATNKSTPKLPTKRPPQRQQTIGLLVVAIVALIALLFIILPHPW